MYQFVSSISFFVRQFLLPNPFEPMPLALIYNWVAGAMLYPFTFAVVGMFYERGSDPAWGSFLYLFFYAVHTGLLMLTGYFGWSQWAIVIIAGAYIGILILIKTKLCYRIY